MFRQTVAILALALALDLGCVAADEPRCSSRWAYDRIEAQLGYANGQHLAYWTTGSWPRRLVKVATVSPSGSVSEPRLVADEWGDLNDQAAGRKLAEAELVSGADTYLLVSVDRFADEILVRPLDSAGVPGADWRPLAAWDSRFTFAPRVAATFDGERFWIVWSEAVSEESWEVRLIRVSAAAELVDAAPIVVATGARGGSEGSPSVSIACTGELAWIAWGHGLDRAPPGAATGVVIDGARVSASGELVDAEPVPIAGDAGEPLLAALAGTALLLANSSVSFEPFTIQPLDSEGPGVAVASRDYEGRITGLVASADGFVGVLRNSPSGVSFPCADCTMTMIHFSADGQFADHGARASVQAAHAALSFNGAGFVLATVAESADGDVGSGRLTLRTLDGDGILGPATLVEESRAFLEEECE